MYQDDPGSLVSSLNKGNFKQCCFDSKNVRYLCSAYHELQNEN